MSYVLTHTEAKILLSFLFNFLITKKKSPYLEFTKRVVTVV